MFSRSASLAILVALSCIGPKGSAEAGERKLFENIRGWEVERNVGHQGPNPCQMAYSYKDKDDGGAENAIVLMLSGDKVNLVLGYGNWEWDKDEKVDASFSIDKQVVYRKQGWTGDNKLLVTQLPEAVIPKLLKGKQIVLKFEDGDADFDIPGFADAFAGLKRCDAAPAAPPAQAAVPTPNTVRMTAYYMGLLLQRAVATCEVNTTGAQRTALDGRVAALRPEMAPVEAELQDELKKPGAPGCPKEAADKAQFETELNSYIALGPEDYTAAADRRSTERKEAKAKADAEAAMRADIERDMRAQAEAKRRADAEAQAKAEMETRIRAEVEAKLRAEAEAKAAAAKASEAKVGEAKPEEPSKP